MKGRTIQTNTARDSCLLIRTRKEINIYYHNIVNGGSYNLALKNTQYNVQGRFQVSKLNTEVI